MMYKAKVAVCSDIRTKHSTQSERHVEFLNVKPWWYVKKPLGFRRLMLDCRLAELGRYYGRAVGKNVPSQLHDIASYCQK
jgi:hypothetical protein